MNPSTAPISPRRNFLKALGGITAGIAALPTFSAAQAGGEGASARPSQSKYMGDFAAPKLETVKVAIIGVGARGSGHAAQLASLKGVEFVGICDLVESRAKKSEAAVTKAGHKPKVYFGDKEAWKRMLAETKPDAVFIVTPWDDHAPMCVAAIKAGAHAFSEVPIACTIQEMWDIVDTSEATGKHCMMMENVNYGREELLYLNMVRQGAIGELLHGEAAYIHELRSQMENGDSTGSWRTFQYAKRNGNLYPTHGLGPVAQYMNLGRTEDNFSRIVSFSSPAKGRALYAKKSTKLTNPEFKDLDFKGGDMSTSIIKTALGRTIMVQWDETSPRPYSRHNLIQGTKGTLAGFPNRIAIEGVTKSYHEWAEEEAWEEIAAKYEHPLYKRMGELSKEMGGHGGMDYLMLFRIIECLRKGEPLDQNVYEGCFWSAVGPLSEKSVAQDGSSQVFPDFTRGGWKTTKPLGVIS
ncbi:Gfo/Idh/MocA family oxidoreductase [Luteolibacter yonseiensis]|uniref:Gfo/Idh/MocA family oxidoreductase n=1 Tax=Luteolibacter yonseiensis TaxID=1144680 RepID=A0A934R5D2_9BACT|nr:Gfo/Idh/MocA family oxidoreductase [Luteolibacter yonseiensis]MBK1817259.1 Gfo/Idh/MocA family oxidoreductase [Luteolibacter yonseiensis]